MNKKELQVYRRQLLLFITGVFLIGFLTGGTLALIYSSAKPEPTKAFTSEVQKTITTNYPIVQRTEPSPTPTEAPEEPQEAISTYHETKPSPTPTEAPEEVQKTTTKPSPTPTEAPKEKTLPYTTKEVQAIALTLAGECYENQPQDKRNVAWVICNRVADGRFGKGVVGVVSSKNQFSGYWKQSRPVSKNDLKIAEEVLAAYYAGEKPIHNYLYFSGGTGKTNNFK